MDAIDNVWEELVGLPADPPKMRDLCKDCGRPSAACWCGALVKCPIQVQCKITLLQHPAEEKRSLRTAPMLARALLPGQCLVFKGKKFPLPKHKGLAEILNDPNTILLYPSKNAVDLEKLPKVFEISKPYNLVLIDGTWPQAKGIYHNTPQLHNMRQAKLLRGGVSEYVIRTQPVDGCLSTVETAAEALSILEGRSELREALVRPLRALCRHQLDHGAVWHHSTKAKVAALHPGHIGRRLAHFLRGLDT